MYDQGAELRRPGVPRAALPAGARAEPLLLAQRSRAAPGTARNSAKQHADQDARPLLYPLLYVTRTFLIHNIRFGNTAT
jgi:hypothetical protein